MSTSHTRTQYRAMTRAPGERRFKWRHFTGAIGNLRSDIEEAIRLSQRLGSVDWEYRIEEREVTTTTTPWKAS